MEKRKGGKVFLDGEEIHARTPWEAMQAGIAFTSENRKYDGLFLDMSLAENCIVPRLKTFSKPPFGFLDTPRIGRSVDESIRRLNIRTSSSKVPVRKLSGGNQQKVLLSMWLGIRPKVLIVDEPTKGVDVGAKNEIFAIIRDMADAGTAVIVISSELLEIIAVSDRVLVFRAGEICTELDHREITEEKVVAWASGVGKDV
jgi:ABC-type sugar transport system ATPase subunit